MSTDFHTAITNGAAANAGTFNDPLGDLDAAIGLQGGGTDATAAVLKAWTEAEAYELTSITRNGDGVVTGATTKWPDGSAGTFTADTVNGTWLAIDAYHITHTDSSQTVTQTAVTRNADGDVTTKPALSVS